MLPRRSGSCCSQVCWAATVVSLLLLCCCCYSRPRCGQHHGGAVHTDAPAPLVLVLLLLPAIARCVCARSPQQQPAPAALPAPPAASQRLRMPRRLQQARRAGRLPVAVGERCRHQQGAAPQELAVITVWELQAVLNPLHWLLCKQPCSLHAPASAQRRTRHTCPGLLACTWHSRRSRRRCA